MSYINALRRNYRFRRGVEALCALRVLRATGHFAFAASEWRLIASNAAQATLRDDPAAWFALVHGNTR